MAEKQVTPQASVYSRDELIQAAPQAFKVSKAVAAGALHDVTEPITKAEAQKRITAFSKAVIKEGGK
jgi:hypothetical protein